MNEDIKYNLALAEASNLEAFVKSKVYNTFKKYANDRIEAINNILYSVDDNVDVQKYSGYSMKVFKRNIIKSVLDMFSGKTVGCDIFRKEITDDLTYIETQLHIVNAIDNEKIYSDRDVYINEYNYLRNCLDLPSNMIEIKLTNGLMIDDSNNTGVDFGIQTMDFITG